MSDYPYRKNVWYNGVKIDIKARTEEELGIKYAKKIEAIEKGYMTSGGSTPVNKWTEYYFDTFVAEKVVNGTLADRKSIYKKHIRPYIGAMKIRDVKSSQCQDIINRMNGYSKDRIDKTCQLLYNIFKKARSEKLIYENPAEDLKRPHAENGQGRAATLQETALMLMIANSHKAGLWLKTILYCGFRPAETDRFKAEHINYDAGLVYIDGTKSAAAKRIVPAPATLLQEYAKLNKRHGEYIFTNAYGDRMRKSSRAKLWHSFKREMNISVGCRVYRNQLQEEKVAEDLVPYCFRHSFATSLKDANIPFRIRQELLGHADSSVTDNYTHRTEESLETARKLLNIYRQEQSAKIAAAIDDIRKNGYDKEKAAENLIDKFFPGV